MRNETMNVQGKHAQDAPTLHQVSTLFLNLFASNKDFPLTYIYIYIAHQFILLSTLCPESNFNFFLRISVLKTVESSTRLVRLYAPIVAYYFQRNFLGTFVEKMILLGNDCEERGETNLQPRKMNHKMQIFIFTCKYNALKISINCSNIAF